MLVALVVSYCILGAYTFQRLESENELQVSPSDTGYYGERRGSSYPHLILVHPLEHVIQTGGAMFRSFY